jgi:hypothetical protein
MPAINEFPLEATSFEADDYIGIDQKVGSVYVTKKIKKSNAFPLSYFKTAMGNPPTDFAAGGVLLPMIFNGVSFDANSEYNTTNGRFTPANIGVYELSLAMRGQGLVVGDIPTFGIYGGATGGTLIATIANAAFDSGGDGISRGFVSVLINHTVAGHYYRVLINNPSANIMTVTPDNTSSFFMGKRIA